MVTPALYYNEMDKKTAECSVALHLLVMPTVKVWFCITFKEAVQI